MHIVEQSDWPTLAAWRATSRAGFASVAICLRLRYEEHVRPFVDDVPLFNSILDKHGAIISGSTALHFFVPDVSWSPDDLDLYVADTDWQPLINDLTDPGGLGFVRYVPPFPAHESRACQTHAAVHASGHDTGSSLGDAVHGLHDSGIGGLPLPANADGTESEYDESNDEPVLDAAGAGAPSLVSSPVLSPTTSRANGLRSVRKFVTRTGQRVDVIRSPTGSPITPLRFFWSTLVMNFLTPHACVCGYPSATLERIGVLKQGPLRVRDNTAVAKYRDRRDFYFVGNEWRSALDMWDHLFFGERNLIALDYRISPGTGSAALPIQFTARGWVPSTSVAISVGEFAGTSCSFRCAFAF